MENNTAAQSIANWVYNTLEVVPEKKVTILTAEVNDLRRDLNKTRTEAQAYYDATSSRFLFSVSFNGEKNDGELGPIKDYHLDYDGLRWRSHQAYLENDLAKTIIEKLALWIVAAGLKLNSQPVQLVLKSEGINVDTDAFSELMEARFEVWAKARASDYANMQNLNLIAQQAYKNSKIGGDVLIILRYINKTIKAQLIDGCHVRSPLYGTDDFAKIEANGNECRNGVEMKPSGEHVAYWVQCKNPATGNRDQAHFERIVARSPSTGLIMAYLVFGSKNRIDNFRGVPVLTTVLENLKILDRFKTAALGTAEEINKIVYQVVHNIGSDGEDPNVKSITNAFNVGNSGNDNPVDDTGKKLAGTVQASTNKQTFNMPIGSEIKPLHISQQQKFYKEFYDTHANIICSAIGIPPNVAFSIYTDSFSASRAAIKDWEHYLFVHREDFAFQFYQPIVDLFMHIQILQNKVEAPGYLTAFTDNNEMALGAYRNSRFTGPMFQGVDPFKEAQAVRLMLGDAAANIPLTTVQQATEDLNAGDSRHNLPQFSRELKLSDSLGMKIVPATPAPVGGNGKKKEDKAPPDDNKA